MRIGLLVLAVLLVALPARAQDAVLVLDASNSMWGRVDGRPKIAIARDAVATLAAALPRGARVGLMAYGHRRSGDCADIELLIPPGPVNAEAFAQAAAGVTPRGRTPIADSIAAAARVAPRIILVSDGIETCAPDPCGSVRALKGRTPRLQVHVIGFDVPMARDQTQLRCIAEATGGRFVSAASAAELARALASVTASPPPPAAAPAEPPAVTSLTLEAVEAEDGSPLQVGEWTLVTLTTPQRTVLSGNAQARPTVRVPEGRYEVRARVGTMRLVERFDATAPAMTQRVVFNPGTLRTVGTLAAGSPPRAGTWMVWADEVPGYRVGEPVLVSGVAQPVMRLVQGSYRVRFRTGEAQAETVVFVTAGQPASARIDLDAGELVLVARRGGQPVLAQGWEFVRQGETVAHTSFSDVRPRVVLPAGQWLVRLRFDNVWFEQRVTLPAGQTIEVVIPVT